LMLTGCCRVVIHRLVVSMYTTPARWAGGGGESPVGPKFIDNMASILINGG
jgi:hypothetical protein